jgi:hypothetical protein
MYFVAVNVMSDICQINQQNISDCNVKNNRITKCYYFCQRKQSLITPYKSAIFRDSIGCSFKFILKVGVEESIVNAPLVSLQSKNINNAKQCG